MKKVISLLTVFIFFFSALTAVPAFAADDTTPPQIDFSSLKVTLPEGKSTVTDDDTVTFSIKVSDDSGINRVVFFYYSPSHSDNEFYAEYNSATQEAVYRLKIKNTIESGTWKLFAIGAEDIHNNVSGAYNSCFVDESEDYPIIDLSAGDFTVDERAVPPDEKETNPPVIDAASVKVTLPNGRTAITPGEKVKLSVSVTDESEITSVKAYYFFKRSNNEIPYELSYNSKTNKFEGDVTVGKNEYGGTAALSRIYACDKYNNKNEVYNSALYNADNKADFSSGNFRIIRSISSASVSSIPDCEYTGKEIKPEPFVSDDGYTLLKGTDYSLSYKNNIAVGKASVTITGMGDYSGSITNYFNITRKPSPPAVKKPKTTKILKLFRAKTSFKVKWKKVGSVDGYEIQYSVSKKFKKAKKKQMKKSSVSKAKIKKLKSNKVYYVRIRTYKYVNGKKYISNWSQARKVKTK